jgi:regulator of replication initiation timing
MDYEKKIQSLLSENEFLQEQLEEMNETLAKVSNTTDSATVVPESEAFLRSKMEMNRIEMEQMHENMRVAREKAVAYELMNESLENDLLFSMKARQQDKVVIKELVSNQTNIDTLSEELNETAALYKRVKALKSELAAAKSEIDLLKLDNGFLREKLGKENR